MLMLPLLAMGALPSCSSSSNGDSSGPPAPNGGGAVDAGDAGGGSSKPGVEEGPWSFVTLKEDKVTVNGVPLTVEYVRADRPDGRHSYLLYQHALKAGSPLVIFNEPYAGIDWTGEEVDERWAKGGAAQADVDAPNYNGKDQVAYKLQTAQDAANDNVVWTYNGFATVRSYARFYAGGSLEDDVLDSAAPYYFARTRPAEFDLARIGSIGGSWGGMMALFGASHAPKDTPPLAVVAMSPPSDFVKLWTWSKETLPPLYPQPDKVDGFYSPYWRRASATVGSPPGGEAAKPYTHEGICSTLRGKVLVPHDSWDLLIPVTQTQDLVVACKNVEPLYWPRGPIDYQTASFDHGPAPSEGTFPAYITLSYTHLVMELAPPSASKLSSMASRSSLALYLNLIVAEQRAGHDVSYVVPRLLELTDPRLEVFEAETSKPTSAAGVVALAINDVWKTSFNGTTVRTQLQTGLPSPP